MPHRGACAASAPPGPLGLRQKPKICRRASPGAVWPPAPSQSLRRRLAPIVGLAYCPRVALLLLGVSLLSAGWCGDAFGVVCSGMLGQLPAALD